MTFFTRSMSKLMNRRKKIDADPVLTQFTERVFLLQIPEVSVTAEIVIKKVLEGSGDMAKVMLFNATPMAFGDCQRIDFPPDQHVEDFHFLLSLCVQIHGWLKCTSDVVSVIVTQLGDRDPSPLLAACYLMFSNPVQYYHGKSTLCALQEAGIESDLPSVERYATWFGFLLTMQDLPSSDRLRLKRIRVVGAGKLRKYRDFNLIVTDPKSTPLFHAHEDSIFKPDGTIDVVLNPVCTILGDFEVSFIAYITDTDCPRKSYIFRFSFSTLFLPQQSQIKVNKKHLDHAASDADLPSNFSLVLDWEAVGEDDITEDQREEDHTLLSDITYFITRAPRVYSDYSHGDEMLQDYEMCGSDSPVHHPDDMPSDPYDYVAEVSRTNSALRELIMEFKESIGEVVDEHYQEAEKNLEEELRQADRVSHGSFDSMPQQRILQSSIDELNQFMHTPTTPLGGSGRSFSSPVAPPPPPAPKIAGAPPPPPSGAPAPPPPPSAHPHSKSAGPPPPPRAGVPAPPPPPGGRPGGAPPPPPPPGGIPPPPPPPGAGGMGGARMKSLYWKKMQHHLAASSVWKTIAERSMSQESVIDISELGEMFEKRAVKPAAKKDAAPRVKTSTAITSQRAQNIGIVLTFLKLKPQQIVDALKACDGETLTRDSLEALQSILPNEDEIKGLKREKGTDVEWGPAAEYFYLTSVEVPDLEDRLSMWLYTHDFDAQIDDVVAELKEMEAAFDILLDESTNFTEVLSIVLALGNTLNKGTSHGAAMGFAVSDLGQLSSVKANDGKSNLMEFLVKTVATKCPQLSSFVEELDPVSKARSLSLSAIQQNVRQITTKFDSIVKKVENTPADSTDTMTVKLKQFVADSRKAINACSSLRDQVQQKARNLSLHFGEGPSFDEATFFTHVCTFRNHFETTLEEYNKKQEMKKRQQKKKENAADSPRDSKADGKGDS